MDVALVEYGTCTGCDDCEEFTPSEQDPMKCAECGDGKSKHRRCRPSSSEAARGILPPPTPSSTSFTKEDVLLAFKTKAAETVQVTDARRESLAGYRPRAGADKASSSRTTKGSQLRSSQASSSQSSATRKAAKASKDTEKMVKVQSVMFITCGTHKPRGETTRLPLVSKAPSRQDELDLEKHGCLIRTSVDEELQFNEHADKDETYTWLKQCLPAPLSYYESLTQPAPLLPKHHWLLGYKENGRIYCTSVKEPAGKDLGLSCGMQSSSRPVRERHIVIIAREKVPDSVYAAWRNNEEEPTSASDSDADSDMTTTSDGDKAESELANSSTDTAASSSEPIEPPSLFPEEDSRASGKRKRVSDASSALVSTERASKRLRLTTTPQSAESVVHRTVSGPQVVESHMNNCLRNNVWFDKSLRGPLPSPWDPTFEFRKPSFL